MGQKYLMLGKKGQLQLLKLISIPLICPQEAVVQTAAKMRAGSLGAPEAKLRSGATELRASALWLPLASAASVAQSVTAVPTLTRQPLAQALFTGPLACPRSPHIYLQQHQVPHRAESLPLCLLSSQRHANLCAWQWATVESSLLMSCDASFRQIKVAFLADSCHFIKAKKKKKDSMREKEGGKIARAATPKVFIPLTTWKPVLLRMLRKQFLVLLLFFLAVGPVLSSVKKPYNSLTHSRWNQNDFLILHFLVWKSLCKWGKKATERY